jgi:hypothetical protein
MYVNVYEVDRQYGGPEEGGWWYDTGEVVLSERFYNLDAAEARVKELADEYPKTGFSSSVIYSGGDYRIWIEDEPAQNYPDNRPHYE